MNRAALLALLALAACGQPHGEPDLLGFLHDGATRAADATARLGPAAHDAEAGRILVWRLAEDDAGFFPESRFPPRFDDRHWRLVLELDAGGVLRRHALVPVAPLGGNWAR